MRRLTLLTMGVIVWLILSSCAQQVPTATPRPTAIPPTVPPATPTQAVVPTPTAPGALTVGQLAAIGKDVYRRSCGVCHDGSFAGALSVKQSRFNNAQQMFTYMRTSMPSDAPGSLKAEEYLAVLAMVLVEDQVIPDSAVLDTSALNDIVFKK